MIGFGDREDPVTRQDHGWLVAVRIDVTFDSVTGGLIASCGD